jgi:hypothetical protein
MNTPDRPQCFLCGTPVEEIEGGLRLDLCACCGEARGALCAPCFHMMERIEIVGLSQLFDYLDIELVSKAGGD